jgi:hypothetical protein
VARLSQFPDLRLRAGRLYVTTPLEALLAWTTLASTVLAPSLRSMPVALLAVGSALALVLHRASLFAAFARSRGLLFAAAVLPLHVFACAVYSVASTLGRLLYHAVGESQPDPVVQAFSELGARTWPPIPSPRPLSRTDGVQSQAGNAGSQ